MSWSIFDSTIVDANIFDYIDSETVSQTYWIQKQYSLANCCIVAIYGKLLLKIDSISPNMGYVCHLGTTP